MSNGEARREGWRMKMSKWNINRPARRHFSTRCAEEARGKNEWIDLTEEKYEFSSLHSERERQKYEKKLKLGPSGARAEKREEGCGKNGAEKLYFSPDVFFLFLSLRLCVRTSPDKFQESKNDVGWRWRLILMIQKMKNLEKSKQSTSSSAKVERAKPTSKVKFSSLFFSRQPRRHEEDESTSTKSVWEEWREIYFALSSLPSFQREKKHKTWKVS